MRPPIHAFLALAVLLQPVVVGCLGEQTVEQGPACPTFDPVPPAGTARLDLSGPKPQPALDSFVLTVTAEDGDTVEEARFHGDGCVGFSLPGYGEYTLTAEAPHPEDEDCQWQDTVEQAFSEDEGYVDVELTPRSFCT